MKWSSLRSCVSALRGWLNRHRRKRHMRRKCAAEIVTVVNESHLAHVLNSAPVAVLRRRGKSLTRRKGQAGNVFQKGRRKSDEWLAGQPAYVRVWKDVPGSQGRQRELLSLGPCATRSMAEREAKERIGQGGFNSCQ